MSETDETDIEHGITEENFPEAHSGKKESHSNSILENLVKRMQSIRGIVSSRKSNKEGENCQEASEKASEAEKPYVLQRSGDDIVSSRHIRKEDVSVGIGEHQVFFDNLREIDEWKLEHPDVEILFDETSDSVNPDQMPSIARQNVIEKNELVHLTYNAILARLEVLFGTHPLFSERDPIVTQQIKEHELTPFFSEKNFRKPIDAQSAISILEQAGFPFVVKDGKVFMLVDSVIPASENTDGRFHKIRIGEYSDRKFIDNLSGKLVQFDVNALIPSKPGSIGIRPMTRNEGVCYAISAEKLLELHFQNPGIEHSYFSLPEADDYLLSYIRRKTSNERIVALIYRAFDELRKQLPENSEFKQLFQDEFTVRDGLDKQLHYRKKRLLYKLLTDNIHLRPILETYSYFPKEPAFVFYGDNIENILYRSDSEINLEVLSELSKAGHWSSSVTLYLEDILTIIRGSIRYY